MKQMLRCVAIAAVFSNVLFSCKKIEIPSPPSICNDSCRIENVYGDPNDGNAAFNLIGRFYYNDLGDPTFVEKQEEGTGNPDYSFLYDSKNRLTDFIEQYRNGAFEKWHRYKFDSMDRIVLDSFFILGTIVNGEPKKSYSRSVTYLEYDAAGRVSKEYKKDKKGNPVNVALYTYNAQGNRSDRSTYDNKINIHRLNKIWQFVDRDYSVNNPTDMLSYQYNDHDLPSVISIAKSEFVLLDIHLYNSAKIDYTCK